jgi:hypothetical protein
LGKLKVKKNQCHEIAKMFPLLAQSRKRHDYDFFEMDKKEEEKGLKWNK